MREFIKDAHGDFPKPSSYVFFSRTKGLTEKMSPNAVNKQIQKHAQTVRINCDEIPAKIHAHQLRHAKATHWLEGGMNILQISLLLGHEQLQTTMVYLDVTTEQEAKALVTLEEENEKNTPKKWKSNLSSLCGVRSMKPMKTA